MRKVIGIVSLALLLCGCGRSHSQTNVAPVPEQTLLSSGQIVIARPIPNVSTSDELKMLGFLPIQGVHAGLWLVLDSSSGSLTLMEGESPVTSTKAEGLSHLRPGKYQVLHKQRSALWYAPDSYFSDRNIPVPGQGDKSRYRRGALGEFVVYLAKDFPLHSGPVWSPEIGGLKLPELELSRIYYKIPVGADVEVK